MKDNVCKDCHEVKDISLCYEHFVERRNRIRDWNLAAKRMLGEAVRRVA